MLTRRLQIQAIADRLAGLGDNQLRLQDFESPLREVYQAVREAPPGQEQQALAKAISGCPDGGAIMGAVLKAKPGNKLSFQSLHDLAPTLQPIEWLWPGWIPKGMLSMLGAIPGAGKSYLSLDLARRIILGDVFPDGSPVPVSEANVIYVDAEAIPQLINERASAWEMDCRQLYLMLPGPGEIVDLSRLEYQDRLVEMVYALRPSLVVIDSLSLINSKGENNIEDVRGILSFLNAVAGSFNCGLLLVHHLRKRGPQPLIDVLTIDDFRGSSHIIAMARSVMGLSIIQTGPRPDPDGPRRLEIIKTNLARYPAPIGVEFVPLHPTGVTIRYGSSPEQYKQPTKADLCMEWMMQLLKENSKPMRPKEIVELAEFEGFSRAVVYRARGKLGDQIVDTEGRQCPSNQWGLQEMVGEGS